MHPGLHSAIDLLQKLRREARRLDQEVTPDNFFNFNVTAYHLWEWVDNDPAILPERKANRPSLDNPLLAVARDIANGSKHFMITRYKPSTSTESAQGYGVGRFNKGAYGTGEMQVTVRREGMELDGLAYARNLLSLWESFFAPVVP